MTYLIYKWQLFFPAVKLTPNRKMEDTSSVQLFVDVCQRLRVASHEKSIFLKISYFFFSSNFFKATIDSLTTRILNFMVIEIL